MKRKRSASVLALCVALIVLFAFGTVVHARVGFKKTPADAGSFSGDSDYGGGDSGSWGGGDSSWGDSSSYSSSGGSSSPGSGIVSLVILIIIVTLVIRDRAKRGVKKSTYQPTGAARPVSPQQSAAVADKIRVGDPYFTEAEMREKVANLYVNMQSSWEHQDWEPMRAHLTDELFSQMGRQLQELINRGYVNKMERIAVLDVSLLNFYQDEHYDNLTLRLQTRLVDYTIERKTGKLVSGDMKREKFMTYEWTMIRTVGAQSKPLGIEDKDKATSFNCPHCGAPIDLAQSARCDYCGSIVKATDFDWVLSRIRGVSQKTM